MSYPLPIRSLLTSEANDRVSQPNSRTELARATLCLVVTTASAGTSSPPAAVLGGTGKSAFSYSKCIPAVLLTVTARIIPAHNKTMGLALTGAKAENDTVIKTTTLNTKDKSFAWCLLLTDDAAIDCPNVGKGSF